MRTTCHGEVYPFVHDTPLCWALVGPVGSDSSQTCNMKVLQSTVVEAEAMPLVCHQEHVKSVKPSFSNVSDVFATHADDDDLAIRQRKSVLWK